MALVICGVAALVAAAGLVAVVLWLDMSPPGPIPYAAMVLRAFVLGGFFLFLGWLMLRVGRSMMAAPRRD